MPTFSIYRYDMLNTSYSFCRPRLSAKQPLRNRSEWASTWQTASHICLKVPCFSSQISISFDMKRLAECSLETCPVRVRHASELRRPRTSDLCHNINYKRVCLYSFPNSPKLSFGNMMIPRLCRSQGLNRFGLQLDRGFRQQLHCNWEELERNVWDLLGSRVAQMQKNWLTRLGERKSHSIGKTSI